MCFYLVLYLWNVCLLIFSFGIVSVKCLVCCGAKKVDSLFLVYFETYSTRPIVIMRFFYNFFALGLDCFWPFSWIISQRKRMRDMNNDIDLKHWIDRGFYDNQFSGLVPWSIGNLVKLQTLYILSFFSVLFLLFRGSEECVTTVKTKLTWNFVTFFALFCFQ